LKLSGQGQLIGATTAVERAELAAEAALGGGAADADADAVRVAADVGTVGERAGGSRRHPHPEASGQHRHGDDQLHDLSAHNGSFQGEWLPRAPGLQ
jgi:hypothetical protein